jgi:hypothetical protein
MSAVSISSNLQKNLARVGKCTSTSVQPHTENMADMKVKSVPMQYIGKQCVPAQFHKIGAGKILPV